MDKVNIAEKLPRSGGEGKEESSEFLSSKVITPEVMEGIKYEDGGSLKKAQEELSSFAAQENGEAKKAEREKLLDLATAKLDEMQAETEKKRKGFLNKLMFSEEQINVAQGVIATQRLEIAKGILPDMVSVKKRVKFADDVDVSGFPENPNKQYSANLHTFGSGE